MKNTNRIGDFRVRLDILITTSDKGWRTQTPNIIDTMYLICSNTGGRQQMYTVPYKVKCPEKNQKLKKMQNSSTLFPSFKEAKRAILFYLSSTRLPQEDSVILYQVPSKMPESLDG